MPKSAFPFCRKLRAIQVPLIKLDVCQNTSLHSWRTDKNSHFPLPALFVWCGLFLWVVLFFVFFWGDRGGVRGGGQIVKFSSNLNCSLMTCISP